MQNRIIWIFWQMWAWKTLYATILSAQYNTVFWNYIIKWHPWHTYLKNIFDVENIPRQEQKGLFILDEANLNFSWRDSMSWKNKVLIKLLLLSRKKNLDLIIIWQDYSWVDKYVRNLCEVIYILKKIQKHSHFDTLLQIYTKKWSMNSWFMLTRLTYLSDPIFLLKKLGLLYNTADLSVF